MKTLELKDFFSTTNQKNGVWFEPVIDGEGVGFEFKVVGIASDSATINLEIFEKDLERAKKIQSIPERNEVLRTTAAKRAASFIKGIRGKDGVNLQVDGKDIEYSDELIEKLMYESIPLQTAVFEFASTSENFMNRKKN